MNFDFSDEEESENSTVFRDVIFLAFAGITVIFLLAVIFINDPKKNQDNVAKPTGNVFIELFWPNNMNSDVDLWVKAPQDKPVGYYRRNGRTMNLLRDDLGSFNDITDMNYENAVSRGIEPGLYVINVHLFRNTDKQLPVPIKIVVSTMDPEGSDSRMNMVLYKDILLYRQGEEVTVVRFKLTERGKLVKDSVDYLQQPLANHGSRNQE